MIEKESQMHNKQLGDRYLRIFDNLDDAIFLYAYNGDIIDCNKQAVSLLGYDKETILQMNFIELFHNKLLIKKKIEELDNLGYNDFDYNIHSITGAKNDINISMKYFDEKEKIVISILKDISEKIWVEEALNKNLTLVLTLLETIPNPIFYTDDNGVYLGCNNAYANFIGVSKERIIGNKIEYIVSEELSSKLESLNNELLNSSLNTLLKEEKLPYPDGVEHYFVITISKFKMHGEKILGLIGVMLDISQQKAAEQKLSRLYTNLKNELTVASKVQKYLLPGWFINKKNFIISAFYEASAEIGGDLYDLIKISPEKFVFYVADISGHGVQAALIMTAVKSIINMLIQSHGKNLKLGKVITELNEILSKHIFAEHYMTLLISIIDMKKNTLTIYSAGHPALALLKNNKITMYNEKGSIPIGWVENHKYSNENEMVLPFNDDETYLFYTDGVYEAENKDGIALGIDGFVEILETHGSAGNVIELPYEIQGALTTNQYDLKKDDFTLIALQRKELNTEKEYMKNIELSYFEIRNYIKSTIDFMIEHHLSKKKIHLIELLITELLNNIFAHGKQEENDSAVTISIKILPDNVEIISRDLQKKWKLPDKKYIENLNLDKYSTHGRGLHIIYEISEFVELKRIGEMNYLKIIVKK